MWLLLLITTCLCVNNLKAETVDDSLEDELERFCYPAAHKNTRKSCECVGESAPPWGMRAVRIDCSYRNLQSSDITSDTLPLYADTLDISWNSLTVMPPLASESLRLLNVMHNNISQLASKDLAKLTNLHELYLSWNSIQSIEAHAFEGLAHLQSLDLSHNNLRQLPVRIFAPLLALTTLSLSWNRQLNQNNGLEQQEFYSTLGVNLQLRSLELEACSLTNLKLLSTAPLVELNLRRNQLAAIPENLPSTLLKLDMSDNALELLTAAQTANFAQLEEFLLEDMPQLRELDEQSLAALQSLKHLSLQNSRNLVTLHGNAFGNVFEKKRFPQLRSVFLRGTAVRTFNATLAPIFTQLTELELNGVPLSCDCELMWLKQMVRIETFGRCMEPYRLRGMLLTDADVKEFNCESWPRWAYGMMLLGLIVLCSAGIYLTVMGLRPDRGVVLRRKVGAGSPYARVTIEPNRQE